MPTTESSQTNKIHNTTEQNLFNWKQTRKKKSAINIIKNRLGRLHVLEILRWAWPAGSDTFSEVQRASTLRDPGVKVEESGTIGLQINNKEASKPQKFQYEKEV